MTPLQQASKNLLEIFYTTGKPIDVYVYDLRKALADEQAQAVEPAIYQSRMRPTWFDEGIGWTPWECCSKESFENYTKTPNIHDWQYEARALFTHPAPPPAAGDHIENNLNMVGKRAELIARLIRKADARDYLQPGAKRLNACRQAANMLEADAREIAATERQVEILSDELSKCTKAQQVAAPATGNTACNSHPDAPHGFSRNASHSAGRYFCDCEGWVPDSRPKTDWAAA